MHVTSLRLWRAIAPILSAAVAMVLGAAASISPWAGAFVLAAPLMALAAINLPIMVTVLFFAGRFSEFPFADQLPKLAHASWVVVPFVLLGVAIHLIRYRRRTAGPMAVFPLWTVGLFAAWTVAARLFVPVASQYSNEKTLDVSVLCPLLFLTPLLFRRREISRTLVSLVAIAGLLGVVALPSIGSGERMAALGGGPNVFSRFTGMAAIVCLGWSVSSKTRLRRVAAILGLIGFSICTVLSGSRGSTIGLALALMVGSFRIVRNRRLTAILLLAALSVLCLTAWLSPLTLSRFSLLATDGGGTSVAARGRFALVSLEMAVKRPLTGWGPGSFALAVGITDGREYSHNLILELLSEYGIVGLTLVSAFAISIVRPLLRRRTELGAVLLALFGFALLVSQFSGDLFDSRMLWFLGGLCVAESRVTGEAPDGTFEGARSC